MGRTVITKNRPTRYIARSNQDSYLKKWNWRTGLGDVSDMGYSFYDLKAHKVMSIQALEKLSKAPKLLTQACFLGANVRGLYQA